MYTLTHELSRKAKFRTALERFPATTIPSTSSLGNLHQGHVLVPAVFPSEHERSAAATILGVSDSLFLPLIRAKAEIAQPLPSAAKGLLGGLLPSEDLLHEKITWESMKSIVLGSYAKETGPTLALERAKNFLSDGCIIDARQVLQEALLRWPKDQGLLRLQRVISPGRVVAKEKQYKDRRSEISWIAENRQTYKGKWVALMGDQLIAMADDLKTLLDDLRERQLEEAPLIHRLD
jgi:hypothetical protein